MTTLDASETVPHIYLIYGEEFLIKEQVERLIPELLGGADRNVCVTTLSGADPDISALYNALFTESLFGGPGIAVLENLVISGGVDGAKLIAKAVQNRNRGEMKAAVNALARFMASADLSASDAPDLGAVERALGKPILQEDSPAVQAVLNAYLESPPAPGKGPDDAAVEALIATRFPSDAYLIVTSSDFDRRRKLFKAFEEKGKVIECEARTGKYGVGLDKDYFADRVRGSLAAEGKSISAQALDALYSRAGTELRTLNEELRKLISFVGDRAAITPADVSQVCDDLHKAAFYELTQSLRTRDFQKCVVALHENMKITAHPLQTLAMIISEVRKLMIARELLFTVFRSDWRSNITFRDFQGVYKTVQSSEAGKTSLKALTSKDYALYMLLKDAQRFTLAELGQFMEWALEADIKLKSTKLAAKAPYLILEELVLKMTLGPKAGVQS